MNTFKRTETTQGTAASPTPEVSIFNKITLSQLRNRQQGKIGWILLWLIGVPVPILVIFFLLRGCT